MPELKISELKLEWIENRLSLKDLSQPKVKAISVDFQSPEFLRRLREPVGSQLLVKAIGFNSKKRRAGTLKILDATVGLGTDAVILAAAGCDVLGLERNPIVFQLLEDGLKRAAASDVAWTQRLQIKNEEAAHYMNFHLEEKTWPAEVVYLDPMYPENKKTALPKKEMQLLRKLLHPEAEEMNLKTLELALNYAQERVVLKRPPLAPALGGKQPHHSIEGKAVRYDIYLT